MTNLARTSGEPGLGSRKPNLDNKDLDQTPALLRLLQLEADIRRLESDRELVFHMANESRGVLGFRQAFIFRRKGRWKLTAVSSVTAFDAQAPLNLALQKRISKIAESDASVAQRFELSEGSDRELFSDYAFAHAIWVPMQTRRGVCFAGILMLREAPWPETVEPLTERVAATYAHAWEALSGKKLGRRFNFPRRVLAPMLTLALLALGFIQAPLTVLTPVEVTGRDRVTVAAAINGVVEEVLVSPNTVVEERELLARYDDTELRNALEISDRETIVARAQLEKLQNASFTDRAAARELKVAEAELDLALAESALARERLSNIQIRAPRAGLAVFTDPRDLIGKPVSVGERLMEIVDPNELELTIRLPVDDSIVLRDGAPLRVFLDSNPLTPISGKLTRRSYRASTQEDGIFAYTLTATADQKDLREARLGAQGTAQIFGDRHSMFFVVFRRPYSWVRQRFGL